MFVPRAAGLLIAALLTAIAPLAAQDTSAAAIPLPEHPRPDLERAQWQNLNGRWDFAFDATNQGEQGGWTRGTLPSPRKILVPFSWGSELSGVPDSADIGWYARSVTIPSGWQGRRVYLVVGASDWRTSVWLDGVKVGEHQGGYTPFSVELTRNAKLGSAQRLVEFVGHRARDESGRDAIGRDTALGVFLADRFEHADHAGFGRGIIGLPGITGHAHHRRDFDDAAEAFAHHQLHRCAREAEGRGQIDVENLIPILVLERYKKPILGDFGVGHQDVELAQRFFGVGNQRLDRIVGQIAREHRRAAELCGERLQRIAACA